MGEPYCHFFVGCRLPSHADQADKEVVGEMLASCNDGSSGPRYHKEYDQARDFFWWGERYSAVHWGFQSAPNAPDESVMQRVQEAWEALPKNQQRLLGQPSAQVLLGDG
jgi:hypothetical protein